MSARTTYNPERKLSADTFRAIDAILPRGWSDDYASNIENKLRVRGEHELADTMLAEIEMSCGQREYPTAR